MPIPVSELLCTRARTKTNGSATLEICLYASRKEISVTLITIPVILNTSDCCSLRIRLGDAKLKPGNRRRFELGLASSSALRYCSQRFL
jgi:hypothetical protein